MKGIPMNLLLVMALVALSQAWSNYGPEDTIEQDTQLDELQDFRGFNEDSIDYAEDPEFDVLQDLRGFNADSKEYTEDASSYSRHLRSPVRKLCRQVKKAVPFQRRPKTQQKNGDVVDTGKQTSNKDEDGPYVPYGQLPQDRKYFISYSLAGNIFDIMDNINVESHTFSNLDCSSSTSVLQRRCFYVWSIRMRISVETECTHHKSSSFNTAVTQADVTFSMSPKPHFIIDDITIKPKTDNDFRRNRGILVTIKENSRSLINFYLKKSKEAVESSPKISA